MNVSVKELIGQVLRYLKIEDEHSKYYFYLPYQTKLYFVGDYFKKGEIQHGEKIFFEKRGVDAWRR